MNPKQWALMLRFMEAVLLLLQRKQTQAYTFDDAERRTVQTVELDIKDEIKNPWRTQ